MYSSFFYVCLVWFRIKLLWYPLAVTERAAEREILNNGIIMSSSSEYATYLVYCMGYCFTLSRKC